METSKKIPEKNPFKVPEKYFEEVNSKILAATSGSKLSRHYSLYTHIKPFITAAAAIAILVTATYFSIKLFYPADRKTDLSSLSITDNAEMLINELDITALENDAILTGMFTESADLSSSEIINYLVQEDIDISDIYERL